MKKLILILLVVLTFACKKEKYNLPNDCAECYAREAVYRNNILTDEYIYYKDKTIVRFHGGTDTTYRNKNNFCDWLNKFETETKNETHDGASYKFVSKIICP